MGLTVQIYLVLGQIESQGFGCCRVNLEVNLDWNIVDILSVYGTTQHLRYSNNLLSMDCAKTAPSSVTSLLTSGYCFEMEWVASSLKH